MTSQADPAALRRPLAIEKEAEGALRRFIRHVLEREPRSLPFLDEVRAGFGARPA